MFDYKEYSKKYHTKHYTKHKRRCREYYQSNRKTIRKKQKNYYRANKAKILENHKKYSYSATPEDLEKFYKDCKTQKGKCRICEKISIYKGLRRLMYDHNHATKAYRGAICCHCNQMLGFAKDQILTLQRAMNYLKRSKTS